MIKSSLQIISLFIVLAIILSSCNNTSAESKLVEKSTTTEGKAMMVKKPSDVMPSLKDWKIMLGNGNTINDLAGYMHKDYFYTAEDNWIVFKTPNAGITSKNSSNTRSELHERKEWVPMTGGKLTGTLKVQHVSNNGDARVAASYSTVVGQIHGAVGHENEPIKIFYKKFPGHDKGSVFWNYEINTAGKSNKKRWDFSNPVWGYDMSVVGDTPTTYPPEPKDGVQLGEEFSYEINVYKGIMYVSFMREGHPTKTFTKSLIESEYVRRSDIPKQTMELFAPIGQDGTEKPTAYAGEKMYFKQGAYNQTNGKDPESNMVWCSGSEIYDGDQAKQYANGSYTEVWFKESSISPGTPPQK